MDNALKLRSLRSRLFDQRSKMALGIAAVALVLGLAGSYALAGPNAGGMMGAGSFGMNAMQNMMNGAAGGMMNGMMRGNSDMNAMHRAMHGEDPEVDMNAMHQRMLAGNLTQEDLNEMSEHCPMMR